MVVLALVIPIAIGIAMVWLEQADRRPRGVGIVLVVGRGYPFALAMAMTVGFLAVIATVRKVISLARRWEEAHIDVVREARSFRGAGPGPQAGADPGGPPGDAYAGAKGSLCAGAHASGAVAGRALPTSSRSGSGASSAQDLDVLVHPSDIVVSGTRAAGLQAARVLHRHPAHLGPRLPDADRPDGQRRRTRSRLPDEAGARTDAPSSSRLTHGWRAWWCPTTSGKVLRSAPPGSRAT